MANIKLLSIAIVVLAIAGAGFFLTQEQKPEETVVIRILDSSDTINNWEIGICLAQA